MTYGAKVNADSVTALLNHALDTLVQDSAPDELPVPICIWGLHGIGKTELVRDLAYEKGCQFVYIAPAQFEEMGDLTGMPQIALDSQKGAVTRFVAPEWVPQTEGPGILLLDDVNRADDRILRGIMQLLQNYALVSWTLPAKWLILLTANPDNGDYSVTAMDDAMLTRMLHVTLTFDVQAWARWAERKKVDERGLNFVLTYPELVNGRRTTPRSLAQFFQAIQPIENLQTQLGLVKLLADASLDEATAQAFINFVHLNLDRLPAPSEILESEDFYTVVRRLEELVQQGDTKRLDILSVVIARLTNYLLLRTAEPTTLEFENLRRFLLLPWLPNDLRLSFAQELTRSKRSGLLKLYADEELGKLLLHKM